MSDGAPVTISAVVAAYNCERFIGEALDAILGQTRPPDEVVVVDDGSTDGTGAILRSYGDRIRVVAQPNGGCPAAFNRAFREAGCEYVAMCGADDIWEPRKLEWQTEALVAHPEIDVSFGDARTFGLVESNYERPPGSGMLDREALTQALYRRNIVCAPSIVIRRRLFDRLGPFVEDFGADDYEYWMRALAAGAAFHYEPRVLLRYRRHEENLSNRLLWMRQCSHRVHTCYADQISDPELVREVLAEDLFAIGRHSVDEGLVTEARSAFRASLRQRRSVRARAWVLILELPASWRDRAAAGAVSVRRALIPG